MQTATSLANHQVFLVGLNPLDAYNDTEFISRYRVTRVIFIEQHQMLAGFWISQRWECTQSYHYPIRCCIAVSGYRFVSNRVATTHGISKTSVSDAFCSFAK